MEQTRMKDLSSKITLIALIVTLSLIAGGIIIHLATTPRPPLLTVEQLNEIDRGVE